MPPPPSSSPISTHPDPSPSRSTVLYPNQTPTLAPNANTNISTNNPPAPVRKAGILDALRTIKLDDFTTFYQKPCAREALLTGIGAGFAIGGLRFVTLASRRSSARISKGMNRTNATGPVTSAAPTSTTTMATATASTTTSPSATPTSTSNVSRRPVASALSAAAAANNTLSARAWRSMTWAVLAFTLFSTGAHLFCQRKRSMEHAAMARAGEIVARKREEKRLELVRRREEREMKRREHEGEKRERSRWGGWFGGGGGGGCGSSSNNGGGEGGKKV